MEFHFPNGIVPFDEDNYSYWSNRMQTYLTDLGVDIWLRIVNSYKVPKNASTNPDEKKLMISNSKARHIILSGLTPKFSSKVMACNTTKEVWDKLKIIYEGYPKGK
jgi:hypothetical protein